ncbi:MAG: DoxX family protein [Microbacteriaceae bacterium]|nr:DoxX family protein [Microbacteriaceae bacterium]
MTIALWITAALLTVLYLGSGGIKVVRSQAQLKDQMIWTTHASAWQVKLVGALEVLGALGVILPLATGIAPIVTAIAALCLALVQVVALIVHVRIKDVTPQLALNVFLLLLAVAVAVLRFVTL